MGPITFASETLQCLPMGAENTQDEISRNTLDERNPHFLQTLLHQLMDVIEW
jgi:hypothetical protein